MSSQAPLASGIVALGGQRCKAGVTLPSLSACVRDRAEMAARLACVRGSCGGHAPREGSRTRGRRALLSATVGAWASAGPGPASASVAPCAAATRCVSSNPSSPPSRFVPPLVADGVADVEGAVAREVERRGGAGLGGGRFALAGDVLEIADLGDGLVGVRLEAAGGAARRGADPPGCFTPGCINGPPQRRRLKELADALGFLPLEPDEPEEKVWVPLLLH